MIVIIEEIMKRGILSSKRDRIAVILPFNSKMNKETVSSPPEFILVGMLLFLLTGWVGILVNQGMDNADRTRVVKEVIMTLTEIQNKGMENHQLTKTNFSQYFLTHIKAKKTCFINSIHEGCWAPVQGSPVHSFYNVPHEEKEPGLILTNGAYVVGFNPRIKGIKEDSVYIDWNGPKEPNKIGKDQFYVDICFEEKPCDGQTPGAIIPVLGPSGPGNEANQQSFYKILIRT